MAQRTVNKAKIAVNKDCGNPKSIGNSERVELGIVMGIANNIVKRTMPNGDVYEGLGGTFEARPHNEEAPIVQSGVLYMPGDSFHRQIADVLFSRDENDEPDERLAESVSFGFVVCAVKAANAAGYSWELEPIAEPSEQDPLEELRKQTKKLLEKREKVTAIEDKSAENAPKS